MTRNERLRALRDSYGDSRQQFAERVKMSVSSIAMIETGNRELTDRTAVAICTILGISQKWLLDGIGEPQDLPEDTGELWEIIGQMANDEKPDRARAIANITRLLEVIPEKYYGPIADFAESLLKTKDK